MKPLSIVLVILIFSLITKAQDVLSAGPSISHDSTSPFNFDLALMFQQTPEYIVLMKPDLHVIENNSGLNDQCSLMSGEYLTLLDHYRSESLHLISLLEQARQGSAEVKAQLMQQTEQLRSDLKQTMTELNRLAKPEWNSESLQVIMKWALPTDTIFVIPKESQQPIERPEPKQFTDLMKSRGLPTNSGLSKDVVNDLRNYKKRTFFDGLSYQITEAQFMGEESAALLPFFGISSWVTQLSPEKTIYFEMSKAMTWLEYCQFTRTVEFSTTVKFALKNFGGGYAELEQKFILRSF